MKVKYKIKGIDCANCAAELERSLKKIQGMEDASISFITEKMILEFADGNEENIMEEVKRIIKKEEPDVTIEKI